MTPQFAFTLCAPVKEGQEENLRQLLDSMNASPGYADPQNALLPFGRFGNLHMSRFVIVESMTAEDARYYDIEPRPWPPTLVFMGDCDGRVEPLLKELIAVAEDGLRKIFSHCEAFPQAQESLLDWMNEHLVNASANYVNYIGRTVKQIHEEQALHQALRTKLFELQQEGEHHEPAALQRHLQRFIKVQVEQGRLTLSPPQATPAGWCLLNWLEKLGVPLLLLMLAPLLVVALPIYLIVLRRLEKADPEIVPPPDAGRRKANAAIEDWLVSNQFTAFGEVKPGRFRRYTIVFLLFMLNYSAKHVFNRGYLTRVQTIHFARWILLDDKNRVLFASNYDGSLESYMDDFINKVAWGLNLVFSNGIGYPRTRFLIKGGAEYEHKFKNYLKRRQVHTNVWYKAYPGATAVDLARNSRIRQGLEKSNFLDDHEIREWLSLI